MLRCRRPRQTTDLSDFVYQDGIGEEPGQLHCACGTNIAASCSLTWAPLNNQTVRERAEVKIGLGSESAHFIFDVTDRAIQFGGRRPLYTTAVSIAAIRIALKSFSNILPAFIFRLDLVSEGSYRC